MEQKVTYILIFMGLVVFVWLLEKLRERFRFGKKEEKFFTSVLETMRFIIQEFDLDNKGDVVLVIEACYEALDFINSISDVSDLHEKKGLITAKAIVICEEKGLDLGDKLIVEVVDRVADYIIGEEFLKLM